MVYDNIVGCMEALLAQYPTTAQVRKQLNDCLPSIVA